MAVTSGRSQFSRGFVAAATLVLILGGVVTSGYHQIHKGNLGAFGTYWWAAGVMRSGGNPYVNHFGSYSYVYPPLYAWLLQPLAALPLERAADIALPADALLILIALLIGSHAIVKRLQPVADFNEVLTLAAATALVTLVPLANELRGLETNGLMLLAFAAALASIDRYPVLAGLALAAGINVKYVPVVAVCYLVLRRRWLAAGAAMAWTVCLASLPGVSIGGSANLRFLATAVRGLLHLTGTATSAPTARVHQTSDPSSISITSSVARLAEMMHWPHALSLLIVLLIAAAWMMTMISIYRGNRLPWLMWPPARDQQAPMFQKLLALEWCGMIVALLAFSPNTQNRNLVVAALPAMVIVALLLAAPREHRWLPAALLATVGVALVLPISIIGHALTVRWSEGGITCSLLLAAYLGAVLRVARTLATRDGRSS